MNTTHRTGFGAAFAACLLLTQFAFAENPDSLPSDAQTFSRSMAVTADPMSRFGMEQVSATISVKHLDLNRVEDAALLYRRIVSTARSICWRSYESYRVRGAVERRSSRHCFDQAVDNALAQVHEATGRDIELLAGLDRYHVAGPVAAR